MDANDTPKDAISETGQDSEDKGQRDSKPKVYTEDEVEGKFSQQRSVLDKQIAKLQGVTERQAESLKLSEERAKQLQTERDEAETRAIADDPDALREHKEKKAFRDERAEFVKEKAEFAKDKETNAEALADLGKAKRLEEAKEIASRHNVDAKLLVKYGGEDMEAFASDLPKLSEDKKRPDSGMATGGVGRPESAKEKMTAGWDKLHKT